MESMKNEDILFTVHAYAELKKGGDDLSLPAAASWARRLNMKELAKAAETIEEALNDLGSKYSDDEHSIKKKVKDSNGDENEVTVVKKEFEEEFAKAQKEILSQHTDVHVRKIKIGDLKDCSFTDDQMITLEFMIEE